MSDRAHTKTEHPCEDCGRPFLGLPVARYCPACRWRHLTDRGPIAATEGVFR
jgi:hypothetical protein